MGVGKTIQAIAIAYHYRGDWPLFIVTPSFLVSVLFMIYLEIHLEAGDFEMAAASHHRERHLDILYLQRSLEPKGIGLHNVIRLGIKAERRDRGVEI